MKQLQLCKDHPIPPLRLDLRPSTKSTIKTFQENVQVRIDQLTAQREKAVALVRQIPDGEARLVLQLRYGLLDNATKKTPWLDVPALMNYEMETIYRRHRKGIDYLNVLLEQKAPDHSRSGVSSFGRVCYTGIQRG